MLPLTCLIRRSLWEKVGGYDGTILHSDTGFFYRAIKAGARVVYAPAVLWSYRLHAGQLSHVLNSTPGALAGFHRKHFADFGHAYHLRAEQGDEWTVPVIPAGLWRWLHRVRLALTTEWQRGRACGRKLMGVA